jgi:putative hydrolase of the HAD superfamily
MQTTSTYKAIGFDYGGVIKGEPGSFFAAGISEVLTVAPEQFQQAYFRYNKRLNRGELTWLELWKLVTADLGQPDKAAEIDALSQAVRDKPVNPKVVALVDELRGKGYKTALLSNATLGMGQEMRMLGMEKHFDVFHISAETKLVKPEPAAFQYLAEALGVAVSELVFIDDSRTSLSTAEICGYAPILFRSYEQLVDELRELGVL